MNKIDLLKKVTALNCVNLYDVAALQRQCQIELAAEMYAQRTHDVSIGQRLRAVHKFLNYKHTHDTRYDGTAVDKFGRQCITDGYFIIAMALTKEFELPEYRNDILPPEGIAAIMQPMDDFILTNENIVHVTKKELTYYKAIKIVYIKINGQYFSVAILRQVIDIVGSIDMYVYKTGKFTPQAFKNDLSTGVVMPCNIKSADAAVAADYQEMKVQS